jgi:NIMA (never in mitosis gene a)-related kinase
MIGFRHHGSDFKIIKKLGEGAYSVVYKVEKNGDKRPFALKKVKMDKLNETERNNALNEVRLLASLRSPFII